MEKKLVYESDEIKVMTTGRDYDFIATVENKTDEVMLVVFTGEFVYLDKCEIEPFNWAGLLANDDGYESLEAIEKGCFYTESKEDYEDETEGPV